MRYVLVVVLPASSLDGVVGRATLLCGLVCGVCEVCDVVVGRAAQ